MKRRMAGNCHKILLFLVLSHCVEISTSNDAQKTQDLRDEDLQVIDSLRKEEFENFDIEEIKNLLLTDVDDKSTKKDANGGHNFVYETKKEPLNKLVHGKKSNTDNEAKMVRINATAGKEKNSHLRNTSKAATAKVLDAIIHRMISERLHKAIVTSRTEDKTSSHVVQTVAKQNNASLFSPGPKIKTFPKKFQSYSKTEHPASPLPKLGQKKDSIIFSNLEAIAHNILRVLKRREGLQGGARLRYKIKRNDLLKIRDFIKTTRDPKIERNVKVRSAKEALGSIKNLMKLIKKNNMGQTKSWRENGKLGMLKIKYATSKSNVLPRDVRVNDSQRKNTAMNQGSYIKEPPPPIGKRKANVSTSDGEKQKYYLKKLKALRLKLLKDKLLNVLKMKSNDTGLASNMKSLGSKLHLLRRERRNSKKELFEKRKQKKEKRKRFGRNKSKAERNHELRKIVRDKINELIQAIKKRKDVETGSKRFLLLGHGHKGFRKNLISLANLDASKMSGEDLEKLHGQLNDWIRDEEKLERKTEKGETKNEITSRLVNNNDVLSSLERESNDENNVINNNNGNIKSNNINNNNIENKNKENSYVLNSIDNKNDENSNYILNNDHDNENNNKININNKVNNNPSNENEYSQNNIDTNNNQKNSAINMNNVVDNNNSGKSIYGKYSKQQETAQYGSSIEGDNEKNNKNPNNYIYNNNGNNKDSNNGLNSNNVDVNQEKKNNYEYDGNDSRKGNNGDNGNNNNNNKQKTIELDPNGKTNTNKDDNSNSNFKTENILPNSNNIVNNNDKKQKSIVFDYNGQTNPNNQGDNSKNSNNDNTINNMYTEKNLLNSNNIVNDNYDNHGKNNNNKFDSNEVNNVNNNYQSKIGNGNEKHHSNDDYKTNYEEKNNDNGFVSNSGNHAEETIAVNQVSNKITNSEYSNGKGNSFSGNGTSQSESSMNINNHDSKGGPSNTNKKSDGPITDGHKVNNPDYEDGYDYYDEDEEEEEKSHPTETSPPPRKQNTFQKPFGKKGTGSQNLNSTEKHGSKDESSMNMVDALDEKLMGENHHVPSGTTNTNHVELPNFKSIPNLAELPLHAKAQEIGPSQEKITNQNSGSKTLYINNKQVDHDPNVNTMEDEMQGNSANQGHKLRNPDPNSHREDTSMKDNQHFRKMYKSLLMKIMEYFSSGLNRHSKASSFNSQDAFNLNQLSGNIPYRKKVHRLFRPVSQNFPERERNRQNENLESEATDNRNWQEDSSQEMDDPEENILSRRRNPGRNEENTSESNMKEDKINNGKINEEEIIAQNERLTPTDMNRPVTGETRPNTTEMNTTAEMNTGSMNVNNRPSSQNGPILGGNSESPSESPPQKTLGGKALLSDFLNEENKLKSGFPVTLEELNDELNQTRTTYDVLNQTTKKKPDKNRDFFDFPKLPKFDAFIRGFMNKKLTDVIHVINPMPQPKAKVPKSEAKIVIPPASTKNKSIDYQPGWFMPTLKRVATVVQVPNKKTKTTSLTGKTSGEPSPAGRMATSSDAPIFANKGSAAATEMETSGPSSQIAVQSLPGENRLTGNAKVDNLNADEIMSSVKDTGSLMDDEDKISLAQKASAGEVVPLSQGAGAIVEPKTTPGAGIIPPEHVLLSPDNIKGTDDLKPLVRDPEGKMSALQDIQAISKVQKEQESGQQDAEKISDPAFLEGMSNRISLEGEPLADLSVTHSPSVPLRDINSPGSTFMVPFGKRDEKGTLGGNRTAISQRGSPGSKMERVVSNTDKLLLPTSSTVSHSQPNLPTRLQQQPASQTITPDSQPHIAPPAIQPKAQSINHEPATTQVLPGTVSNSVAATQAPQAGPPERKFQNQAPTTSTLDYTKVPTLFQELLKAILTQQKPKKLVKQNAGISSNIQQNTSKMAEEIFDDPTKFGDSAVLLNSEKMETKPYSFSAPGLDKSTGTKLPKETHIGAKLKESRLENGGADKSKTSLFIPNVPVRPEGDEVYLGGGEATLPNTPAATMSILSKSNLSNEEKVKLINAYQSSQKSPEPQETPAQEKPALGGSRLSEEKGDKPQGNMFFKTGKPNGHELKGDVAGKEAAMQDLLMMQKERYIDDKLSQAHLIASQPNKIKGEGYTGNTQQNTALPGNALPGGEIQRQGNWPSNMAMPENGLPGAGLQSNGLPGVDPMENNAFKSNLAFPNAELTMRKQKQMDKLAAHTGVDSSNLEQENIGGKMIGLQKTSRLKSTSDMFDSKLLNSGIDDERKAIENGMEHGKETMGDVDSLSSVGQFVDSVQGLSPGEVKAYGIDVNNDVYIDKPQAQRLRAKSSQLTYDAMMEEAEETKDALKGVRKSNVRKKKSNVL